jgi:hypothetical protein
MVAINVGGTLVLATLLTLAVITSTNPMPEGPGLSASASGSEAERIFTQARNAWQARTEAPFLSYGIRLRIANASHRWDNWWEAYYRNSDRRFIARRLVNVSDDEKRLKGVPLCLPFGIKIFDTNPNAEPIFIEDPTIQAAESFGVLRSATARTLSGLESPEEPLLAIATPLPEIGRTQAVSRDYEVELVNAGPDSEEGIYHLRLMPLRDPRRLRLRELWVSKRDYATRKLVVEGISDGEPYDRARWVASYTQIDGRVYLEQVKNESPLRFGLTTVQQMEIDFVDYHFPQAIPYYLFQPIFSRRHTRSCGP